MIKNITYINEDILIKRIDFIEKELDEIKKLLVQSNKNKTSSLIKKDRTPGV